MVHLSQPTYVGLMLWRGSLVILDKMTQVELDK